MQRSRLVARNVAATLATQLLSWAMTFVVTLYVPRYLGASGLGEITLVVSFAAVFAIMVGLGVSTVLIREIARHRERTGELVAAALLMRIPLGLLACVLGAVAAKLLHYNAERQLLVLISLGIMVLMQLNDVLGSALRGLEEIPRQNLAALAEKLISSVLLVTFVARHMPLSWIVATGAASMSVSLIINATAFAPYFKEMRWPKWAQYKALTVAGLPFLTTYIFVTVYGQSDSLLLDKLSSASAIGWYGLAKRWGGTTLFIPVALASALLPTLSRVYHEDRPLFDSVVRRLVGYMFLLVVPFAAILILAPGPLLAMMQYGPTFAASKPVLIVLGFAIILWYLSQATGTALIASDRQDVLSRATGVAALLSVPVCGGMIWATQRYMANGAIGAIVSDTVIELYMVAIYARALPKDCLSMQQVGTLVKGIIAALPMIAPLYFVPHNRWSLLAMLPGMALYLPLCYAMRCLDPDDVTLFKTVIGRKLGRPSDPATAISGEGVGRDAAYGETAALLPEEQIAA